MEKPLLSIIIVKNSKNPSCEKFLSGCLASIKKNTSVKYEILVEDGGGEGPSKVRNKAVKYANGKYLLFLDYDTQVKKGWLKEPIAYLDKHPRIGGGQLKLLRMDRENIFDSAGDKLTPLGFLAERAQEAEDKGQFDKVEPIFSCKGAAMVVRKSVFGEVGGFDPDYFMYWEEPDLAWRIWKAGYKFVFLPMGTVYHAYGTKEKPVSRRWDIQITYLGCRNQIMTFVKNGVGWRGVKMFIGVSSGWLGLLGLFIVRREWEKTRAILRALSWLVLHLRLLRNKRVEVRQRLGRRFYKDGQWMNKIIDYNRGADWYLGKGKAYITGKPY